MTTALTTHPTAVAEGALAQLAAAWNAGDGAAFGAAYAQDASFVTIRGEHLAGADAIGAGHAGIFATIYRGSVNQMVLVRAEELADGVILVVSANTLTAPTGPLAGTHTAMSTSVLVREDSHGGSWRFRSTHNTLVTA